VLQSDDLVAETEPLSDGLSRLLVAAADRDAVVGRPLSDGLRRGLPLARTQLLEEAQRIPDNLRVVALPVTPETAAGGQIVPGNDVEILVTTGKASPGLAATTTVVDRVTVYATGVQASVGAFTTGDRSGTATRPLSWLSVLASAEQARAIATARASGDLQVNLLPPARAATNTETRNGR
jgi:Flp pilus assembly protein CpaB